MGETVVYYMGLTSVVTSSARVTDGIEPFPLAASPDREHQVLLELGAPDALTD